MKGSFRNRILLFYLFMELFIDHERGFILGLPWLRGGTEIAPCHANGLGQSPNQQILISAKKAVKHTNGKSSFVHL